MVQVFTTANFDDEVLKAAEPVLVDFWAPWCGPCKVIGPIVADLAKDLEGKPFKIGKVNVDENPELAGKLGILGIPTLAVFKGGQTVKTMVGVQQKATLREALGA